MSPIEISNLATAIHRWLSYQCLCGREALLSEAYLGQPVAEFLMHHHGHGFEAEVDHPVLVRPGPGRPRQFDYALRNRLSEEIEVAIECKWIAGRPYDKQRILNDLLRLECVRTPGKPVRRYFVVAGLKDDFDRNFKSLKFSDARTFTRSLLSFSISKWERRIEPLDAHERIRELYKRFEDDFNAEVPRRFATRLLGYRTADGIAVAIWQVAHAKGRLTFSPADLWAS